MAGRTFYFFEKNLSKYYIIAENINPLKFYSNNTLKSNKNEKLTLIFKGHIPAQNRL